jgi:hypothetical protein
MVRFYVRGPWQLPCVRAGNHRVRRMVGATAGFLIAVMPVRAFAQSWPDVHREMPSSTGITAPVDGQGNDVFVMAPLRDEERLEVDRAVSDLVQGRTFEAASAMSRLVRQRAVDSRGHDVTAVLFRLATGVRSLPRTSWRSVGEGALPAPPSDRETMERVIDGATDLLIAGNIAAARVWLSEAQSVHENLGEYHPVTVLRRLAFAAPLTGLNGELLVGASTRPLRPRYFDTLDAAESATLYGVSAGYGITLGLWTHAAFAQGTSDAPTGTSVLLPILGAGVGVGIAAVLDARNNIRRGRVYAANAGFYLGLQAAFGVRQIVDGPLADATRFGQWSAFLGAATLGMGGSLVLAHLTDAQPGSASFVWSGGFWGGVIGAAVDRSLRTGRSEGAVGLLVGEGVGIALTLATAHLLRPTPTQTRWLDLGALVGAIAGTIALYPTGDSQIVSMATALGCLTGGMIALVVSSPSETERVREHHHAGIRWTPSFQPTHGGGLVTLSLM